MTRITRINFSLMHPFHPCNPWLDLGMAEHARFEKLVAEAKKNITEISPEDAAAKLQNHEAVIVDVREKDEWEEEDIPHAIDLSRGTIQLEIEQKVTDANAQII